MAEAPEVVTIQDEEDEQERRGPCNPITADEYTQSLDDIMLQFKELVLEDWKDVLLVTINALKWKMMAIFEQMRPVDVDIVLQTVKDMRCLSLWQMMESDMELKTDPDDDVPTGHEVVGKLSQTKKLSQPAIDNIISLFNHLSEAHAHMSTAAANLSLISQIADAETLCMILRVSIRPMVHLTIPECFLNLIWDPSADTSRDTMMHKIEWDLLPKGDKPILAKEPDNGPTRLLCAVLPPSKIPNFHHFQFKNNWVQIPHFQLIISLQNFHIN